MAAVATHWNIPEVHRPANWDGVIDLDLVWFASRVANTANLSLPELVRLVRSQTDDDPRPNKQLYELELPRNPALHTICHRWNRIVREGVTPVWTTEKPHRQGVRPSNHSSLQDHLPQVWEHIAKDQRQGRYLIVDASLLDSWSEVFVSPLGVIAKGTDSDGDIRIINDYSFPDNASGNSFADRTNFPEIVYNPPGGIARRIALQRLAHPGARVKMLLGDVAGAFRHVPVHEYHVHMFAFVLEQRLIFDLSLGFGWCGSPSWYYMPGALINDRYEAARPSASKLRDPFLGNFWCDDHACVDVDQPNRCFHAQAYRSVDCDKLSPSNFAANHILFAQQHAK